MIELDPTEYTVSHEGGVWAETDNGPVHVEQGATLPAEVTSSEVSRLANGGTLEGFGVADVDAEELPDGSVAELKVRIGEDPDLARRYLDREQSAEKPRPTFVTHLESVIAADDEWNAEPPAPVVEGDGV